MKRREDVRSWLRGHGHGDAVAKIDKAIRKWTSEGKKTRRNWWDVLAGDKNGNPRRVNGIAFPVIEGARQRQRPRLSLGSVRTDKKVAGLAAPKKAQAGKAHGRRAAPTEAHLETFPMASARPRPFVKWAGGKRQLLPVILEHLPATTGSYLEPFLGGAAVFFALSPDHAFLSDSNERLVRCYIGVKEHVDDVISLLKEYRRNRRFFQKMRELDIDRENDAEIAAWFIYLNKTGYNGLYRVNSKNKFNVPYGDNKHAQIYDEENLRACSHALARAELRCEDFETAAGRAMPGDIVYFDPPYVPLSATSYFTSYTAGGFTPQDQIRLRDLALRLRENGVRVLLSNSSSAEHLYRRDFSVIPVLAARQVNSRAERRGKITELLIT